MQLPRDQHMQLPREVGTSSQKYTGKERAFSKVLLIVAFSKVLLIENARESRARARERESTRARSRKRKRASERASEQEREIITMRRRRCRAGAQKLLLTAPDESVCLLCLFDCAAT
jgi:hypothetical protein